MKVNKDSNGHLYVEWCQAGDAYKRAWVQHKTGEKDWANTKRYLNVVRCNTPGHPGGNPTDFPIFNDLSDAQVLLSFVYAVNAITGCKLDH